MELIPVAGVELRFVPDPSDRLRIEASQVSGAVRQPATKRDRARAPLLEGRIVEVGERLAVQDLVAER